MKPQIGRFIDPLSDFGFKRLFGTASNKDILIHFLNQLFLGQKVIDDIVYSPTEHNGEDKAAKRVFFDLLCTGNNGERFIIEMQRSGQKHIRERVIFYTTRLIHNQVSGGGGHWDMGFNEVYLIAILDFCLGDSLPGTWLQHIGLTNKISHQSFYDKLEIKFLELPNFVKKQAALESDLERWIYLLRNMSQLDSIPEVLNMGIFRKSFDIAEYIKLSKEEKAMYDSSLKAQWDWDNTIAFAAEQAAEKAAAKAKKAAEEAYERSQKETIRNIVLNLKSEKMPANQIARVTGLSIEEIQKI